VKTLTVHRYATGEGGVQSELHVSGEYTTIHGLECPWMDNAPNISCIPGGAYVLLPYSSEKYPNCLQIIGGTVADGENDMRDSPVTTRFRCLVHPANYARQLRGCLAAGLEKDDGGDPETGLAAVWNSRKALDWLIAVLVAPAQMIVRWEY